MKLKSLLFAAGLMFVGGFVHALTLSELGASIRDNTKLTILQSATPAHFYDLRNGESKGGVSTSIVTYKFLTLDAGWLTALNGSEVGTAVLGGSLHVDKFISEFYPEVSAGFLNLFPKSAQGFIQQINFGVYSGNDFDRKELAFGIFTGIQFDISK